MRNEQQARRDFLKQLAAASAATWTMGAPRVIGDEVSAGDVLYEITDSFGRLKAETTADSDGIFWRSRRLPQVAAGEYVCSVGTNVDSY